eukprot:jgi/Undpi1/4156/HiC_scaffold_16.g07523.m1
MCYGMGKASDEADGGEGVSSRAPKPSDVEGDEPGYAAEHTSRDPRAFWKRLGREAVWNQQAARSRAAPFMKHPVSGCVLTHEKGISVVWGLHHGRVAADMTGNSRRCSHWVRWRLNPSGSIWLR